MAAYYSDLITDPADNTSLSKYYKAPVGISGARTRTSVARATGLFLTTDVVRMASLHSSRQLLHIGIGADGASTAGAVNLGLYLAGTDHDGAVVDVDLFASAQSVASALDPWAADGFVEATTLGGVDRGKKLWELAALGAASYTEDPDVMFDICIVPSTSLTVAASELSLWLTYTAGD